MNEQVPKQKEVISIDSRYERGKLIGRGGAGSVYEGLQIGMNRKVAIKILNQRSNSNSYHGRFEREARAVAQLNHRNCIRIYDNGYDKILDCHYMAMEFVQGETLSVHIQKGLSVEEILNFSTQILAGIQHAHEQGILHRDIKPSNVLISDTGVAKVLDFGLALTKDDLETVRISRDGAIYGSPPYMSPEQCRGELTIDARSDLYSFGAMLYEMLEGELPFVSTNVLEVLLAHTTEAPPRVTSPDVPPALTDYVDRLLSKKPEDRFESASAALDILQEISAVHALRLSRDTPLLTQAAEIIETWEDFEPHVVETKSANPKMIWAFVSTALVVTIAALYFFMESLEQSKITLSGVVPVTSLTTGFVPTLSKIALNKPETVQANLIMIEASDRVHKALLLSHPVKFAKISATYIVTDRASKPTRSRPPKRTRAKRAKRAKPKPTQYVEKTTSKIEKKEKTPLKTINFEF